MPDKKYITIRKTIIVGPDNIRTAKGNKAQVARTLRKGKKLVFLEDNLRIYPFSPFLYVKLLDEKDDSIYYVPEYEFN